ncbi:MAG: glycosyltransferase family 9 protein [Verrucomicrobiota bacterium]
MKILILQLKRIGDLIQTTPAIHCLREAFPEAHLTLAVDSSCESLLEAIDVNERLVHHKDAGWGGPFGFGPNAWMKSDLPVFGGDFCLDFTGTDRSAWLAFSSSSQRRVTFARFQKKFMRRFVYTDFVNSPVRDRHTADHYTDLLRPLGIQRENVPLDLRLPDPVMATTRARLENSGVTSAFAVIHAGTARPEKYWMPGRWAQVMDFLRAEYGLKIVLTGSSDPAEQAHLAAIKSSFRGTCADLSGKTNLLELAAVIRGAKVFCGVDTAAMHLADAMETPSLALFGPTNPFHWKPRHTKSIVLRADTKEPFSPGQKGGPMDHVSVGSALESVRKLLS